MTSQALLVLFLAHVCSTFGTASEPIADHDSKLTDAQANMRLYQATHDPVHNKWTNKYKTADREIYNNINNQYDDIFVEDAEDASNIDLSKKNFKYNEKRSLRVFDEGNMVGKKREKRENNNCDGFIYKKDVDFITHPHYEKNKTYYRNSNCATVIEVEPEHVIKLTFVDEFHIEYHPDCAYDFLEIRDGRKGYAKLLDRVCGTAFPPQLTTSGHFAWLKFKSDDTIEYDGFKIQIEKIPAPSQSVPDDCYMNVGGTHGTLNLNEIKKECEDASTNLDVLWTITTAEDTKIYLNFSVFKMANPNDCELNVVEVFGSILETDKRLAQYCGSIANPVSTRDSEVKDKNTASVSGNVMNVRIFVYQTSRAGTKFEAAYTAFRMLNPDGSESCRDDEFNCDDNTCIDSNLKCDGDGNCRLKTDEDSENACKKETTSNITQPHIMVILIIFFLILSAMSFVFLFRCFRKLYQDHKIIKEHIRESCEDRLDMVGSRLILDAKRLQRDSEPRASLERENQANEMFKRKRDSFSKRKPTSIDSDYIQETHLDVDEEIWRRDVEGIPTEADDIRIERNGRTRRSEREKHDRRNERANERQSERRSDMSRKEESIRNKKELEEKEKREIRDVSVGAPDTKESGCQTRESLFQADPPPSSDGKSTGSGTTGTNSRGFSTFGYSGATIVRPSPPATNTSEIKIELLRQVPRQDSVKPQKKISDRRPISAETTRSAPDVIIVSKPIR